MLFCSMDLPNDCKKEKETNIADVQLCSFGAVGYEERKEI